MAIRPIETDGDYAAAVDEVGALMDATLAISEGDRLDVLATLVQTYEDAYWPMLPPGQIDVPSRRRPHTA
jgi:HTH-type transcriptional regulator / antitoxin HigA